MSRICVFCGSHDGNDPAYARTAAHTARTIVASGYGIVYGGGGIGLMKVVADTGLAAGGEVIGVIPNALARTEMAHQGLTELHIVATMHERKALMDDLSGAFVALPGGFGTMDEFCEVLSWRQLRIHDKPIGLLNFDGYYDALLALFDSMVREGFIGPYTRGLFVDATTIEDLLEGMFAEKTLP
ncbi:MAG: TIGR00730 family Rossman fold protein [Candidatus Eremiobacteraeota bacterium]|nr:TIGR00730 family Rossman fold protein [Candidatus Eremiobacteraeota bacterium]